MKSCCKGLLFLALLCVNISLSANPVDDLHNQASEKHLWQQHEWHNLIHYDITGSSNGTDNKYSSQVDDDRFFLAHDGATNPQAELLATLVALYQADQSPNTHALCRFPARLNWLATQLEIDRATLPAARCPDYEEWRGQVRAKHVTMVFPAYHLNSPSSMYGHTLLRLDPADPEKDSDWSDWLSFAVNFGADVRVDDNSLFYAFKGLSGGYPGLFITTPYFKKIREYNRDENRDIWEYDLNLDEFETEKLVTHLWELKEINFDYYFFDENCSYRLLELLEVARPSVELTDEFILTAIPVDTVRAILREDMVKSISYRPSMVTELRYKLDAIPAAGQQLVEKLVTDTAALEADEFTNLPPATQAQIVDASYQLHRYRFRDTSEDPAAAGRNYQLLSAVSRHANNLPANANIPAPISPDLSHLSKRANISAGRRNHENYAALGLKMSFHDLEDRVEGFLQGAEINIAGIELRASDDSIKLHRLNAVEIFSLTPRTQFFDPLSWRVQFGLERQLTAGKDQLVTQLNGGAGVSYPLWADSQAYMLAIARLESNKQFDNTLEAALGLHTGLLAHFTGHTMHIEFTGEEFSNDVYRVRGTYTHNFAISRNHSLKLRASREWQNTFQFNDVSLDYQYYF